MRDHNQLVRHPTPNSTESLYGYILRLVEENGYTNWHQLFSLAGMAPSEIGITTIGIDKLADIANRPKCELELITYRIPGAVSHHCRLLNHQISATDLRPYQPMICPECLAENGYIDAHLDLALMTGCPVHKKVLLSSCPACSQPLRWTRPGLLKCRCGASLFDSDRAILSLAETDLLDIIRRKLLGLSEEQEYSSGLPTRNLQSMSLRCLLQLIKALGKRQFKIGNTMNCANRLQIVNSASMVLADWPNNLYRYLEALLRSNISDEAPLRMVNGPLRGFWIYASRSICPNEQVDFLRIALAQFVGDRGGPRLYKELMRRTGTEFSRLLITKQEFASRSGRAVETVNRFLLTSQIPFVETNYGKSKRKLIDSRSITLAPGNIYSRTKAAAIIGIPSHLLRELKTSGIFRTPHYLQSMRGYHELDIQAFIEEMTNLVPDPKNDFLSQRVIAFGSILNDHYSRFATLDVKLSLVRSLLSREVPVLGAIDATVSGLLVSEDAIRQFSGDNLSIRETARLLHCTVDSIAGLIKLGLLRSKKMGRIHLVTNESIIEFQKRYISVSSIAKIIGSNAADLAKYSENIGIPIVSIGASGNCALRRHFIPLENKPVLLLFQSKRSIRCARRLNREMPNDANR